MNKKAVDKYRATVTASMVAKILYLARTESPITEESIQLVAKFAPLQAKIDNAGLAIAYTTSPKESTLESLGEVDSSLLNTYTLDTLLYSSKEAYWEACYLKYVDVPHDCDISTIAAAKEHMYINDLMSEEEIAEFEATSLFSAT